MAKVIELLKAYETIRSHGLEIQQLMRSGVNGSAKPVFSDEILLGNTSKQSDFLGKLLSQAYEKSECKEDKKEAVRFEEEDRGTEGVKGTEEITLPESDSEREDTGKVHTGTKENPIRVSSLLSVGRSFKDALNGKIAGDNQVDGKRIKPLSIPRYEGGNLIVDLDEDDYEQGVQELQFSVVGRLFLPRNSAAPTTMNLRSKLSAAWGIESFKLVPMGGGLHHVILQNMDDQSKVMAFGPTNVSPGTFRVARWRPGFDPACLKTTTQVWVKLYGIPLEFRKGQNLLNIAAAIGTPLRLDQSTINLYQGLYARVLIDIDVSGELPERILASLRVKSKDINVSFFVTVSYEQLPHFCNVCRAIGHSMQDCNKSKGQLQQKRKEALADRNNHRMRYRRQNQAREGDDTDALQEEVPVVNIQSRIIEATGGVSSKEKEVINRKENEEVNNSNALRQGDLPLEGIIQGSRENVELDSAIQSQGSVGKDSAGLPIQQSTGGNSLQTPNIQAPIQQNTQTPSVTATQTSSSRATMSKNSRWEPVSIALNESRSKVMEENRFSAMHADMSWEKLSRLFPDDVDAAIRATVRQEIVRKDDEWERTKKRLELRMATDIEERKSGEAMKQHSRLDGDQPDSAPKSRNLMDLEEFEESQELQDVPTKAMLSVPIGTIVAETQVRKTPLNPDEIYWDDNSEIFIHVSGMCYDPGAKAYYTIIDQNSGDLRPLYYVQTGGDFSLAKTGKLGQSNRVVLDDKTWDKNVIYSVKSPNYKPGLLKMFKEKIKERKN